jgi:hypothetical protein
MWLERPASAYDGEAYRGRRVYTEDQLFMGIARMVTRRGFRRHTH